MVDGVVMVIVVFGENVEIVGDGGFLFSVGGSGRFDSFGGFLKWRFSGKDRVVCNTGRTLTSMDIVFRIWIPPSRDATRFRQHIDGNSSNWIHLLLWSSLGLNVTHLAARLSFSTTWPICIGVSLFRWILQCLDPWVVQDG